MRLPVDQEISVDLIEAMRYLGAKNGADIFDDLYAASKTLQAALAPAAAAVAIPLVFNHQAVFINGFLLHGSAIFNHLAGCSHCVIMGVTLGFEVDRLINSKGHISPYQAMLFDACATAAVESLADMAAAQLTDTVLWQGAQLTGRFSPGYGDFPLETQQPLLDILDARRLIGLSLTRSHILTPAKSVTALIGVSENICNTPAAGCKNCSCQDRCIYRK